MLHIQNKHYYHLSIFKNWLSIWTGHNPERLNLFNICIIIFSFSKIFKESTDNSRNSNLHRKEKKKEIHILFIDLFFSVR